MLITVNSIHLLTHVMSNKHRPIVIPKQTESVLGAAYGLPEKEKSVDVVLADPNLKRPEVYHYRIGENEYAPRVLGEGEGVGLGKAMVNWRHATSPLLRYSSVAVFATLLVAIMGAMGYAFIVRAIFHDEDGREALSQLIEELKPQSILDAEDRARQQQAELAAKAQKVETTQYLWMFANSVLAISVLSLLTALSVIYRKTLYGFAHSQLTTKYADVQTQRAVAVTTFIVFAFVSFGLTTSWSSYIKGAGGIEEMAKFHMYNFLGFVPIFIILPMLLYTAMSGADSISPNVIMVAGFLTLLFAVLNIGYGAVLMFRMSAGNLAQNMSYFYPLVTVIGTIYVGSFSWFFMTQIYPYIQMP